jgi:hypothetical protein
VAVLAGYPWPEDSLRGKASFPRVATAYRKGGVLKERVRDLSNERKPWKWWSRGSKVLKGELILRNALNQVKQGHLCGDAEPNGSKCRADPAAYIQTGTTYSEQPLRIVSHEMGRADSPQLDLTSVVVTCQGQGDSAGRSLGKDFGMMRQKKCRHLRIESA